MDDLWVNKNAMPFILTHTKYKNTLEHRIGYVNYQK